MKNTTSTLSLAITLALLLAAGPLVSGAQAWYGGLAKKDKTYSASRTTPNSTLHVINYQQAQMNQTRFLDALWYLSLTKYSPKKTQTPT